jgi:uncharacterized RDD family membrane protein YckC
MQAIRIQTAQNVFIEYQPASVGDRIVATLIDGVVAWVFVTILQVSISQLSVDMGITFQLLLSLPYVFYHFLSEVFMDGQSIGKKAMNIKVVKLDGSQPSLGSYLLRWLLRLVDVSLSLGVVAMATISAGQKGQRLGDIAAGTAVVSMRQRQTLRDTALPATEETYTPLYPEAARLSDRDVAIIKEALQAYHKGEEQDSWLIQSLAEKVQGLLGTRTGQTYVEFLRTVLKDHAHLTR